MHLSWFTLKKIAAGGLLTPLPQPYSPGEKKERVGGGDDQNVQFIPLLLYIYFYLDHNPGLQMIMSYIVNKDNLNFNKIVEKLQPHV